MLQLILLIWRISFFFSSSSSSSAIASDQLKFWSENVQNKIPKAILKKLSPLSQNDSDANFCSLAKLACTSVFGNAKKVTNTYTTQKTYGNSAAFFHQVKKNEDPFSFFRLSTLKNGNLVHLPNLQESLPDRAFLPPQITSKISLTYEAITKVFPELSAIGTTKETIQTTLSYCSAAAIEGETKSCPKSLEEMVEFAKFALGEKKLLALTSKNTKGSSTELMIRKIKKYAAEKIVACHEAFLPFAAYFCHSLSSTRLYAVEFVDPETATPVNTMLGICHMDTSPWPENHVAFEILKFGPGEGEACHWFTQIDLAWIGNESV
ncbi:hypothetical protein Pfo_016467 [Paulownia fortunei]|nr:hypothetical protein Pfo_016467 [Paulownia fortunei]